MNARKRSVARLVRVLVIALRVVVGLVALHLSGASVLASEIGLDAADDCCTDCPIERSGKECPPACPICHCAHGNIALPTAFEASVDLTPPIAKEIQLTPYEASVSSAPQLDGVYRPPRAISSTT